MGSSVRSALGNTTVSFRNKQKTFQDDDSEDSGFFHDPDEEVRKTAMEMFWSQHVHQIKVGNSVDDEDLSSTAFSDSVSDHSSLMKSAHSTKTAANGMSRELDTTNRSTLSAKTLDPSDLRGGAGKKKKDKHLKRVDFTGHVVDSDDEEETHSRKSKGSSKGHKNKTKKSKKKKSTKKKRKSKKAVHISIASLSDDDAVVGSRSSYEDILASTRPMVSGDIIIVSEDGTLTSEETKGGEDAVAELVTLPRPSLCRRQTTTGTAASAFSLDPSISHVMERIAKEDEKYCDRQAQKELEQEVEELLDENEDLHAELEEEVRRNERLRAELSRMKTKLKATQLQPPKRDDMEILHDEIQRLQEELINERNASERLSKESRSEIVELQQVVDNLREEVSSASTSYRSLNNSGLNSSNHSENGKSIERLQGELLVANGKIEDLEKIRREQTEEIRKLRYLLDKFKENTGVKDLEEKLEASEMEIARLRLELENMERDWDEKVRSKEETIEYFFKEVTELKLQQASGGTTRMSNRNLTRGGLSLRTLTQTEVQDVLRVGPEEMPADEPKRFSWLRGSTRRVEV